MTNKAADSNDDLPEPTGDPNETIDIEDKKHPDGFYRINRSDFDPKKHKVHKAKAEKE